jgi:hypothetical protein
MVFALPLLFLVWANVDVRFVFGIFTLLMFTAASALGQWGTQSVGNRIDSPPSVSLTKLGVAMALSIGATLLNPYGWKVYELFFVKATSAANVYFPDHLSLRFRSPQDYVLLMLTMTAFLALGVRRSRDPFQITLLLLCTFLAFRAQADAWLVVIAAVTIISAAPTEVVDHHQASEVNRETPIAAVLTVLLLAAISGQYLPRSQEQILAKVAHSYPVDAAEYVRRHQLPQPLFNSFPFGGFLAWYLPEYPVAIDGRTELYGADFNIQYSKAMNASIHYSAFAPMSQAGTLLLEKQSVMGKALPNVPGFRLVYSDDVAVVLVRERPGV